MISDDLTPAVAWAPPTKKTPYISRLGNQAINPVGKAHATIRSRHQTALPAAALNLPIKESFVFNGKVFCLSQTHVHPP